MKKDPKKLLRKAAKQIANSDLLGAADSYKQVLKDFPLNRLAQEGLQKVSGGSEGKIVEIEKPILDETEALESVLVQVNQGSFDNANTVVEEKLKRFPNSVSLLNIAGAIKAQMGEYVGALPLLERAIGINANSKEVLCNLGATYHALGRNDAAIYSYKSALKISPDEKATHFNLGNCLRIQGDIEAAEQAYRNAIKIDSGYAEAFNNLGLTLQLDTRLDAAIECFQTAINLRPSYIEAIQNLATSEFQRGNIATSLELADRVIQLDGRVLEAHYTKGNALSALQEYENAASHFIEALKIDPDHFDTLVNFSDALLKIGKFLDALDLCDKAIQVDPKASKVPYNNRGAALKGVGRYSDALLSYEKAIEIDPEFGEGHYNIAIILAELCEFEESFFHYDKAIALNPNFIAAYSNKLFALNYDPEKTAQEIFNYYLKFDEKFSKPHTPLWDKNNIDLTAGRVIRIGYISPDFRKHSARHFIEPLFDFHDKERFQIVAYSEVRNEDQVTKRLRTKVDTWVPTCSLNDRALADKIVTDRIDILIDLAGHTDGNRLLMMGKYKPAPIQVSFMGYGYTTGIKAIDYFFTDAASTPPDADRLYAEQPWRLPTIYAYRPDPDMGPVSQLPALKNQFITFGSLSRIIRLNSRTIGVWSEILQKVPGSKLVINSGDLKFPELISWIANKFKAQGITEDRLLLGYDSPPWDLLRDIDISLDCFPHNSGLTLLESLYMGVPYVTLATRPGIGRLGASFLVALGREEWITYDERFYVDTVVNLAKDYGSLSDIRKVLRPELEKSLLMDESTYTFELENAYESMWNQFKLEG